MSDNMPHDANASEQPIRARVPDHVAAGAFSTGVIVMTANSEFILDFVQNLGRPYQIVARVVLPHYVLPQFVDALQRNMELYRSRWGDLPGSHAVNQGQQDLTDTHVVSPGAPVRGNEATNAGAAGQAPGVDATPQARQAAAQEIYDELKIRDELLSGSYANAVMIGHGPHEFSFDFITNFYPHSSVSSRVFLAAGQVPRLYDSLKNTWEQLRARQSGTPEDPRPNPPSPEDPDAGFDGGPIA